MSLKVATVVRRSAVGADHFYLDRFRVIDLYQDLALRVMYVSGAKGGAKKTNSNSML